MNEGTPSPAKLHSFIFWRDGRIPRFLSVSGTPTRTLLAFRVSYLSLFLFAATLDSNLIRGDAISAEVYLQYFLPIAVGFAWCAILAALSQNRWFGNVRVHLLTDAISLGWAAHVTEFFSRTLSVAFFLGVVATSLVVAAVLKRLEFHAANARSKAQEAEQLRIRETDLKIELQRVHQRLSEHERVTRLINAPEEVSATAKLGELIGASPGIQKIFGLVERVGPSDATVLITGESGTGKELVANALHRSSSRKDGPFVAVNCGAIPAELLESELFGHKRGAFTGATSDTQGMFREANGGTIFLDEVGELPPAMQVKILRALQERVIRPVGASADFPIDVRVLAATNRHLRTEVAEGRFREDLFFRINVINIHLPPLRDRVGDIELLTATFVKRKAKGPVTITPAAMDLIRSHAFPGNVRELENMIERALVLGGDIIAPEHLPEIVPATRQLSSTQAPTEIIQTDLTFPLNLDLLLQDAERKLITLAIARADGSRKAAADLLGINLRSLRYRAEKLGL